jgi:hypothetical protein
LKFNWKSLETEEALVSISPAKGVLPPKKEISFRATTVPIRETNLDLKILCEFDQNLANPLTLNILGKVILRLRFQIQIFSILQSKSATIEAKPSFIDFGLIKLGSQSSTEFLLSNPMDYAIHWNINLLEEELLEQLLFYPSSGKLSAGSSCVVIATLRPHVEEYSSENSIVEFGSRLGERGKRKRMLRRLKNIRHVAGQKNIKVMIQCRTEQDLFSERFIYCRATVQAPKVLTDFPIQQFQNFP